MSALLHSRTVCTKRNCVSALKFLCATLIAFGSVTTIASEKLTRQFAQQNYNFNVLLDNKPIGFHEYSFEAQGQRLSIESQASFDVKVLFINAFKYRHNSQESWQENCVEELAASTNSNGKQQDVLGLQLGDRFKIDSLLGPEEVDGCVQTFAYWNPHILQAESLLNMQTGEYVPIEVTPLGYEKLNLPEGEFMTAKYRLQSGADFSGKPVDITLWYAKDTMQWLALESVAKGKRKLRYELSNARNVMQNSIAALNSGE